MQREKSLTSYASLKDKFQFSIYFSLSNKLETLELMTISQYSLWFEAGGLLFLVNLTVGFLLRPYSDFFLTKDLLNKSFKMDTSDKDKLLTRDPLPQQQNERILFQSKVAPAPPA